MQIPHGWGSALILTDDFNSSSIEDTLCADLLKSFFHFPQLLPQNGRISLTDTHFNVSGDFFSSKLPASKTDPAAFLFVPTEDLFIEFSISELNIHQIVGESHPQEILSSPCVPMFACRAETITYVDLYRPFVSLEDVDDLIATRLFDVFQGSSQLWWGKVSTSSVHDLRM
jgi:hypothetical protein